MKKILIGGLAGGLIVFVWGMLSWMVMPWHNMTMAGLPQEEAIVGALEGSGTATGVYYIPYWPEEGEDEEAWKKKHRAGPLGFLAYHAEGMEPIELSMFTFGLLLDILSAIVVAGLLCGASRSLPRYRQRVAFAGGVGLFAGLVSYLALWNWMHFPTDWSLVMAADLLVAWTLAGLALAAIVKPAAAPAA
jgi:hypothetical protein